VTSLDLLPKSNIIIIMTQSTGRKSKKDVFYVVTRDGRRAWPKDYWTIEEARSYADSLVDSLKSFKDPGYKSIVIVETTEPENIN
jgi:hypothetical protein